MIKFNSMKITKDKILGTIIKLSFVLSFGFGMYSYLVQNWWFCLCEGIRGVRYPITAMLATVLLPMVFILPIIHFTEKVLFKE